MGKFYSLNKLFSYTGSSAQAEYISRYVEAIGGSSFYVEEGYVDHEFMIDYQRFYSRHFYPLINHTRRIHFFKKGMTFNKLVSSVIDNEKISEYYLGFMVVKPIVDRYGNYYIGRTVLRPYEDRTLYVTSQARVSLLGRELVIYSAPFSAQDLAVGACATVALWSTMSVLSPQLNIRMDSLYEITEEANECLTVVSPDASNAARQFPSSGLDSNQICHFLKSKGLEIELLQYNGFPEPHTDEECLELSIVSFLHARIPVIACLKFYNVERPPKGKEDNREPWGLHAVTVLGYNSDEKGIVTKLYVHDDRVGPYVSVGSSDSFKTWKYVHDDYWTKEGVKEICLDHVIVPLYHKVRLPLYEVLTEKMVHEKSWGCKSKVYLYRVSEFKEILLKRGLGNKKILEKPFSRYVWTGWSEDGKHAFVLDTTSPTISKTCEIDLLTGEYEDESVGHILGNKIKRIK